jgi:hypothetical protein
VVTAVMGLSGSLLSWGFVAPSQAATVRESAVPPPIERVSCEPYNGYVIFYNNLGNKCWANPGTWSSLTGFSGLTAMCGGNNRGYFQWDSSDGRNWVTYYERNQCMPMSASSRLYKVVIY